MTQRCYICRNIVCVTFVRREALQLADLVTIPRTEGQWSDAD